MSNTIVRVKKESNWAGDYRLEYDSKYVTIFGKDSDYPFQWIDEGDIPEYEEMVLMGAALEARNITPTIKGEDDDYLYIDLGCVRDSVAWVEPEDLINE